MTESYRPPQGNTPELCPPAHGRPHGRFRRLGHAGPILRHPRRAPCRADRRRAVRRQPHGRDRGQRPGSAASWSNHVTCNAASRLEAGPGAVFRPALRARRLRRRHPGPQSRRRALLPLRQRLEPGEGLRPHRRAESRRRDGRVRERPLRPDRRAGAAGARDAAEADRDSARARSATTGFAMAKWRASRRASRAPAIPAKTASRSTSPPEHAEASGRNCSMPAQEFGIKPCGLGARNTLRLEAEDGSLRARDRRLHHALEARLAWIVKLDKGEFAGSAGAREAAAPRASSAGWSDSK